MKFKEFLAVMNSLSLGIAISWMVITLQAGLPIPPEIGLLFGFCGFFTVLNVRNVWKARKS